MDKKSFDKLPEEKKKIIEEAYLAAYKEEISPSDFFMVCRRTLTPVEYNMLFSQKHKMAGSYAQGQPEPAPGAGNLQGPAKEGGRDEIKTEHIEDIMQYSGIDLKEEADNIVKEAEYHVSAGAAYEEDDFNRQMEAFFNIPVFRDYVIKSSASRNLRISEDGIKLLFMGMNRKLTNFFEKLDGACAIRAEAGLAEYSFMIDNEMSKQLWYLNELEKTKMEKLVMKKDEDQKKKKVIQEREDLIIKKRQSNTVAMAAMGLKQHAWMNLDPSKSSEDSSKFNSIYAPFDEKAFDDKIKNSVINMKDFIYVLEKDKRYNKSVFLIQHYFR